MLSQLFQSGPEFWNSTSMLTIILSVVFSLLIAARCWRWAKLAFENNDESAGKRATHRWPLRPSNLLLVLGFLISMYLMLQHPPFGTILTRRVPLIIFGLAFAIRYSENAALANFGDSKRDERKVEDLPEKDGRLD